MNEKRFKGYAEKTGQHYELIIIDEIGEEYSLTDDFFKSKDVIFEIVDLLNVMNDTLVTQARENHKLSNKNIEQQSTIDELRLQKKDNGLSVYVVRDGKNPVALFFNEQRAMYYCQENMAHLTYQQEKWCRVE